MFAEIILVVILLVGIKLSTKTVVCDVDPSDAISIMLEQLRVQQEQIKALTKQTELQQRQLNLLTELKQIVGSEPYLIPVLAAISSAVGGYVAIRIVKMIMIRIKARQNPELPQTTDLRCVELALRPKSPTEYYSGESSTE